MYTLLSTDYSKRGAVSGIGHLSRTTHRSQTKEVGVRQSLPNVSISRQFQSSHRLFRYGVYIHQSHKVNNIKSQLVSFAVPQPQWYRDVFDNLAVSSFITYIHSLHQTIIMCRLVLFKNWRLLLNYISDIWAVFSLISADNCIMGNVYLM